MSENEYKQIKRQIERRQMKINASHGPDVINGRLIRATNGDSNWDIYHNTNGGYFMSIAKPDSGAGSTVYGSASYIKGQIERGIIKKSQLTKYGRKLFL